MTNQTSSFVKQFPDLMAGKTLLYVHGFGSSGQSGTVTRLRAVLPNAHVVAPDVPLHPQEAQALLHDLCAKEQPDLIIGTSMGGMYAEQLYGYDRILLNPALRIADTMQEHGLTGKQQWFNPRQDGQTEFYVDKALVKEYRQVTDQAFSGVTPEEQRRVIGLFGDRDELVHTYDLFLEHYPNAIRFHGEHRMDDHSYMHSVLPVIRWVDDRQEHRERPIVYIGVETLADSHRQPASNSQKTVRQLIESYQVYFVAPAYTPRPQDYDATQRWLEEYINVPAWGHTIFTNQRHLLYGDYLIESVETPDPMATRIAFGSDTFKSWEDVQDYFLRLQGQ